MKSQLQLAFFPDSFLIGIATVSILPSNHFGKQNPHSCEWGSFFFKWWRGAELNCRHTAFQAAALPLSYPAMAFKPEHYIEKEDNAKDFWRISLSLDFVESEMLYFNIFLIFWVVSRIPKKSTIFLNPLLLSHPLFNSFYILDCDFGVFFLTLNIDEDLDGTWRNSF